MLQEAWQCLNACECYHGIVAVNVEADTADRFLEQRETPADVRLTVQLDALGQETGKPPRSHTLAILRGGTASTLPSILRGSLHIDASYAMQVLLLLVGNRCLLSICS